MNIDRIVYTHGTLPAVPDILKVFEVIKTSHNHQIHERSLYIFIQWVLIIKIGRKSKCTMILHKFKGDLVIDWDLVKSESRDKLEESNQNDGEYCEHSFAAPVRLTLEF